MAGRLVLVLCAEFTSLQIISVSRHSFAEIPRDKVCPRPGESRTLSRRSTGPVIAY